jgi:MFS family permease
MAAPTLGVYQAELFGTGRRGRANGIISLIALAGSALGLLAVGDLSERLGSFAAAFGIVVVAPLLVVVLVLTLYPETAHRELEDINPSDRRGPLRE